MKTIKDCRNVLGMTDVAYTNPAPPLAGSLTKDCLLNRLTRSHCFSLGRRGVFSAAISMLAFSVVASGSPALADFSSTAVPASGSANQPLNATVVSPSAPNFAAGESAQQAATSALPFGANYRIHAGDQLGVQVYGDQSLSQNATVLPDGAINYPLVGRVVVRGLSTDEAAIALTRHLQGFVKHPYVTVSIVAAAQFTILVLGNVKNPGKYLLRSDARVSDAIAAAGGLAPTNGALPIARISLGTSTVEQISLQKLFHDGDTSQNTSLDDGSVVYVPSPNTFDVEVVGSVDHPGNVTLNEGDRLSMAIAKAGNSQNSNADLNHVHITRVGPDGKAQSFEVNLYKTLVAGDVRSDVAMQKNDVVYVPIAKGNGKPSSATGNALLLLGRLVGLPTY